MLTPRSVIFYIDKNKLGFNKVKSNYSGGSLGFIKFYLLKNPPNSSYKNQINLNSMLMAQKGYKMYIEIHYWEEFKQKTLYFKINNCFNMQIESDVNHKFAGIYAIYKNDVCLYVGQSTNLASRIATHLKGKYKESTEIFCWNIENIGFDNFRDRNKESQKSILDNSEKWLMTKLNPIENLLIDHDLTISDDESPNICLESSSCFTINNTDDNLYITDDFPTIYDNTTMMIDFLEARKEIGRDMWLKIREELKKQDLVYFWSKGVLND